MTALGLLRPSSAAGEPADSAGRKPANAAANALRKLEGRR
jgi:hypothetical protein